MLDPICKRDGCYMFAPGTPERAECGGSCRLNAQHLAIWLATCDEMTRLEMETT